VETAVTLVMDGRPMIGETVTVFGQGVVGLLTVQLLAQHPVASLHAVDPVEARRSVSTELGAQTFSSATELTEALQETSPDRSDLTYELTGTPSVLNDAIQATGYSGRVVVGSWYGTKSAPLNLGGHFHRSRLNIISSQVSTIDPSLRGRWTKDRRMSTVLDLLSELAPSRLITEQFPVEQAPEVYARLVSDRSLLQPLFVYD
jgi:threonine dehydrogenase-like Zn-dependent dehydrogenase